MMVETMLESSQDFGMSNGALPQWKRELLQRRAARSRPTPAPTPLTPAVPPPAPAPAPPDDDEELRYGPGIVKRLQSRYLSLALRDAPRRRPSVLRRAASLEHLLDARPPPAPRPPTARQPRPVSLAAPPAPRDVVKRARSVDALSRLDSRDDPHPPSPPPPCAAPPTAQPCAPSLDDIEPAAPPHAPPPPPPPAPRPPVNRSARPPRRPTPLLRETERPPPDVVRSALRKFESAPPRRTAPAARVSAVVRGLEGARSSTPEPRERSACPREATPPLEPIAPPTPDERDDVGAALEARLVSRAALEGIARAGSSMRFAFTAPRCGSHLPPLAATNAVLVGRARRVGVIRPMPAPPLRSPEPQEPARKPTSPPPTPSPRIASPAPPDAEPGPPVRLERRDPPPSALVEPIPRSPPDERAAESPQPEPPRERDRDVVEPQPKSEKPLLNGHSEPRVTVETSLSRLGGADIERAWNGTGPKKAAVEVKEKKIVAESREQKIAAPWAGGSPLGARRGRAPAPAATSVVFNFSDRKEVPDYIENDGIILRASRRNRLKAGEPGVVSLRAGADAEPEAGSSDEEDGGVASCGPPSPCAVRFVNDNVLINGRSCMARADTRNGRPRVKDRQAKLKLQFDDSLTRTFEYPSETSLSDDPDLLPAALNGAILTAPTPSPAPAHNPALLANTHIGMSALSQYTPSKTAPDVFQLGLAPHIVHTESAPSTRGSEQAACEGETGVGVGGDLEEGGGGDARPCGADARAWSAARAAHTDLLF